MKSPKVFLEDNDPLIANMFVEEGYEIVKEQLDADIVCFGGGADVTPELYGEINTHSYNNLMRDLKCVRIYNLSQLLGQICVGICRGGQFLHVMNGFKLYQHIEGHINTTHTVTNQDRRDQFVVTSDHHQAMSLEGSISAELLSEDDIAECIIHVKERGMASICYQPHPEWVPKGHECRNYFFELIKTTY
jgi:gamma-glutamyl-gamma-aminobutyrate hydrolase PuuD